MLMVRYLLHSTYVRECDEYINFWKKLMYVLEFQDGDFNFLLDFRSAEEKLSYNRIP